MKVIKKVFRDLCKTVKEVMEMAKQKAWETFGSELQKDFYNNSRFFWKRVKGEASQGRVVLKDKDGKVLEDDEKVAEWCKVYFEQLYNEGFRDDSEDERMVYGGIEGWDDEDVMGLCKVPTKEEVRRRIDRLKSGKAAGGSGIVGEMIKAGGRLMEEQLLRLFK